MVVAQAQGHGCERQGKARNSGDGERRADAATGVKGESGTRLRVGGAAPVWDVLKPLCTDA